MRLLIIHRAPPPAHGSADTRTAHLIATLAKNARGSLPQHLPSFMSESRRLSNRRIKDELRVKLRYPSVREGIVQSSVREGIAAAQDTRPAERV